MRTQGQLSLLEEIKPLQKNQTTFLNNMKRPVHRWFRFSAGYSSEWVEALLCDYPKETVVLDPFCGSGTTLVSADSVGVRSIGVEAQPFTYKVARAKLDWSSDVSNFRNQASEIIRSASSQSVIDEFPKLLSTCYPEPTLQELFALRSSWQEIQDDSPSSRLCWLALTSILRECSPVGTSNMELIQPKKTKSIVLEPLTAFRSAVHEMSSDMLHLQSNGTSVAAVFNDDIKTTQAIEPNSIDLVITSPPYANNFDYADALRLEMSFWDVVGSWADLHASIRRHLVVSCSQHASAERLVIEDLMERHEIDVIRKDMIPVVEKLGTIRLQMGGKKQYHTMIAGYFVDMSNVFINLRKLCKSGSVLHIVIGDSAPYGVYVPVHDWLGRLSIVAGFESFTFEKTRDRNIKWKNRKHRVPLLEGILTVKG